MFVRFAMVFVAALGLCSLHSTAADAHAYTVVDADGIYLGEGEHPKAPASIVADDVWSEIPEYQTIVEDELTEDDARYHLLMKKATERFEQALDKVAEREGHDMVGEEGAIEARDKKKGVPDITKLVAEVASRD